MITADSARLDFLRALAVLLVVADHLAETLAHQGLIPAIHPLDWQMGRVGVLLFFVHTSLVLMLSLSRSGATGVPGAAQFYVRRAFRILPLSTAAILAVVLLDLPAMAWSEARPRGAVVVAGNLLLSQNLLSVPPMLSPLWSLPLELQMYVVLPVIFWIIDGGARLDRALALWGASVLVASLFPLSSVSLIGFVPCFLSGILAFALAQRVRSGSLPWRYWPPLLVGIILVFFWLAPSGPTVHSKASAWTVCLLVGLAIPFFDDRAPTALRRASAVVAKYSYGIYLAHMPLLWGAFVVLEASGVPRALQAAVFVVSMIVVPVVCFHLIEAPFIRWARRREAVVRSETRAPLAIACVPPRTDAVG